MITSFVCDKCENEFHQAPKGHDGDYCQSCVAELDKTQLHNLIEKAEARLTNLNNEENVKLWRVETKDWICGWYRTYDEASVAFLDIAKGAVMAKEEVYKLSLIPDFVPESEVEELL